MRTDIYSELYLWNRNLDSLIRILQRLEPLDIVPRETLKEYGIRLEELRSVLNVTILERMLTREQMGCWLLSVQREALDSASRKDRVQ